MMLSAKMRDSIVPLAKYDVDALPVIARTDITANNTLERVNAAINSFRPQRLRHSGLIFAAIAMPPVMTLSKPIVSASLALDSPA